MGRLIDANALKEMFADNGEGSWTYNATVKAYIDAQPTAYDVEKVVDQLMVLHDEGHCPNEDSLECVLNKACSDCYREKISEIVRKGGIDG